MLTNLPLAIGIAAAWLVLPFIFKFLPSSILLIMCIALGITTIGNVWSNFQSSLEKTAMDVKDKARRNNRIANIRQRIIDEAMKKSLEDFQKDVTEAIRSGLEPTTKKSQDMFAEVKDFMKKLHDETKKIDHECRELTRQGRI